MKRDTEKMLEKLPEIANDAFRDLQATPGLKNRILSAAEKNTEMSFRMKKMIPVLACALVLAAGGIFAPGAVRKLSRRAHQSHVETVQLLSAIAAGQLPDDARLTGADIKGGSVTVGSGSGSTVGSWEDASRQISLNGAYYRLMSGSVDPSLKGDVLARTGQGCESSLLPDGSAVFSVRGMENACVMAEVNGAWRLFQRVAFGGRALLSREDLRTTLLPAAVASLELAGVKTVSGKSAERVSGQLLSTAIYDGNSVSERGKVLLIHFENGITLQAIVSEDRLMACGTWICPGLEEMLGAR